MCVIHEYIIMTQNMYPYLLNFTFTSVYSFWNTVLAIYFYSEKKHIDNTKIIIWKFKNRIYSDFYRPNKIIYK